MNNMTELIKLLSGGDINKVFDQLLQSNPKFKSFVEENKSLSTEDIAKKYGIDPKLFGK